MAQFPMTKQEAKYHLSMAGEFFVAAELQRRGFSAAVTYGNAKRADVVAFSRSGDKAIVIEVKTTSNPKWIVGARLPDANASPARPKPWVFVYIPLDPKGSPSYYIILQSKLREALTPEDTRYRKQYKETHGEEYGDRAGVVGFLKSDADKYENKWETITSLLEDM